MYVPYMLYGWVVASWSNQLCTVHMSCKSCTWCPD